MNNKQTFNPSEDSKYEGRDKAFMDIDRMINEGLAGGMVHHRYDSTTNIEESRELHDELPPHKCD